LPERGRLRPRQTGELGTCAALARVRWSRWDSSGEVVHASARVSELVTQQEKGLAKDVRSAFVKATKVASAFYLTIKRDIGEINCRGWASLASRERTRVRAGSGTTNNHNVAGRRTDKQSLSRRRPGLAFDAGCRGDARALGPPERGGRHYKQPQCWGPFLQQLHRAHNMAFTSGSQAIVVHQRDPTNEE